MSTRRGKPEPQECAEATAPFPPGCAGAGGQRPWAPPGPAGAAKAASKGINGTEQAAFLQADTRRWVFSPTSLPGLFGLAARSGFDGVSLLPLSHFRETPQCLLPGLASLLSDTHGLQVQVPRMASPPHCSPLQPSLHIWLQSPLQNVFPEVLPAANGNSISFLSYRPRAQKSPGSDQLCKSKVCHLRAGAWGRN